MKLRLLLTEECDRRCKGCCNKGWDLKAIPVCESFKGYDEILITGGEPMVKQELLGDTIRQIRREASETPIYVYTAWREDPISLLWLLSMVDGITLTLHTRKDIDNFERLNRALRESLNHYRLGEKALRLNVFKGIKLDGIDLSLWKVKRDMVWIKDCPLPDNEVFMRLEAACAS